MVIDNNYLQAIDPGATEKVCGLICSKPRMEIALGVADIHINGLNPGMKLSPGCLTANDQGELNIQF